MFPVTPEHWSREFISYPNRHLVSQVVIERFNRALLMKLFERSRAIVNEIVETISCDSQWTCLNDVSWDEYVHIQLVVRPESKGSMMFKYFKMSTYLNTFCRYRYLCPCSSLDGECFSSKQLSKNHTFCWSGRHVAWGANIGEIFHDWSTGPPGPVSWARAGPLAVDRD